MSEIEAEVKKITSEFKLCQNALLALGDETRQHLILEMMKMKTCSGVRVGEITEKTNLSRPAVSHHLGILKDAGIIKMRREGTRNYYYFDAEPEALNNIIKLFDDVKTIMAQLPDRSGEE